jgi:hypothetical protein
MTGGHLTRDRRNLLAAVARGRVTDNDAGIPFLRTRSTYGHRCDRGIAALVDAGLVVPVADRGTYELTDAGQAALDGGSSPPGRAD